MTIEWLAGNRIRGTSAEKPAFGLAAGSVGGWVEVGRTTLGSAGDTISVASLTDKRYYKVLFNTYDASGTANAYIRLNSDSGTNYAWRRSNEGGSDSTTINSSTPYLSADEDNFGVYYIANLTAKEKLIQGYTVYSPTTGAANAPGRDEVVAKWANTSAAINTIDIKTGASFAANSEVVVLGWDPTDSHTTNFWEELASVELGSAGDTIDSGTISAKKYLWVQCAYKASGTVVANIRYNSDSGSNYSFRDNDNGSESTSINESRAGYMGAGSGSTTQFGNAFIINNSANEKLSIVHTINQNAAGAGTAPSRREHVAKWNNTSSQITSIQMVNTAGGSFDTGSIMKVWGSN